MAPWKLPSAAGGGRRLAQFGRRASSLVRADRLFGPQPLARQAEAHALITAADAVFAVSLAGSLFFNVSVDAARPRIILYLLVTVAPFAVVAPLIGPLIGRAPGGHAVVVALTSAARGLICFQLANELRALSFYPLAFSVLVLGKTYSVAKNALVPRLVSESGALVEANSRLSRVGTCSGALASGTGAAVLALVGAPWALVLSGALYVASAVVALRLPRSVVAVAPRVEGDRRRAPTLRPAAAAMGLLRGTEGFVLFALAFVLKQSGEPAWFFGVTLAAYALGGFAGTIVAPQARRRVSEEALLTAALGVPAALAILASLSPGRLAMLVLVVVLGTGANSGRRAFDSLVQRDAADLERGRLFARFETRFQLSWVLGALVAVAVRPPLWATFLAVAVSAGIGTLAYMGRRQRTGLGVFAGRGRSGPVPALPWDLLSTAERLCAENAPEQAVIVAAAAVDAAVHDIAGAVGPTAQWSGRWEELQSLRRAALGGTAITKERAARAIADARELLSTAYCELN